MSEQHAHDDAQGGARAMPEVMLRLEFDKHRPDEIGTGQVLHGVEVVWGEDGRLLWVEVPGEPTTIQRVTNA